MSKSVQILFTDDEFKSLEIDATKKGLTVPLYVKGEVLKNDEFTKHYATLIKKVIALKAGTAFNIKVLFGTDWTMPKGVKLTLGKTYYCRVRDGSITNVKATGKDSSNIMWYEKI